MERTIAFSLGDGIFDIQSLLHSNIVINRFRSDSSLRSGDSHLVDVGLRRAPPVDFPRICSCALASEKGESIPMLSPRDGQAFGDGLKENNSLQALYLNHNSIGDAGAKAPGWGGSPRGWMVKFERRKGSVWEML